MGLHFLSLRKVPSLEQLGKIFSPDFMCSQTHLFSKARKWVNWQRILSRKSSVNMISLSTFTTLWILWWRFVKIFYFRHSDSADLGWDGWYLLLKCHSWFWYPSEFKGSYYYIFNIKLKRYADFLKELESKDAQLQRYPSIKMLILTVRFVPWTLDHSMFLHN